MELAKILDALSEEATTDEVEKTASENNKLETALKAALTEADAASDKTASESAPETPTEELTKIASRLATAEQEALVKEAELYGAALCDGFMSRMDQYDASAPVSGGTKVAAYGEPTAENFEKFASENPELVKQAVDLGYRETKTQLEKVASDAFSEGYEKTASTIKLAAEDCVRRGTEDTYKVLASLRK
tara:strand:+ start:6267 stop:6836 length:570 start_codon:yes stop_codon:yes gene_type:complete